MKESERLKAAKALIDSPEKWMQENYSDVPTDLNLSCRFCSIGAVLRARGEAASSPDLNSTSKYLQWALVEQNLAGDVPLYNDSHSHEEVMQMFDKAIELAEAEGC